MNRYRDIKTLRNTNRFVGTLGSQLAIPQDISGIIDSYNKLNEL